MYEKTNITTELNEESLKQAFRQEVLYNITRDGIAELLDYLDETDFYYAPCSTRYHLSTPCGLVYHSLSVFKISLTLFEDYHTLDRESVAIISLFHDICKIHCYNPSKKNRKTGRKLPNGRDEWEEYIGYDFDEEFPYGHGEKSVYILSKFISLTDEEAMAIRWHMGYSDASFKGGSQSITNAIQKYPSIALLHSADLISTAFGR